IIIVSGSLIFLIIIITLFFYIQRTFEEQKRIEKQILESNTQLEVVLKENEAKNWLLTGTGQLSELVQGEQSERELAEKVIAETCEYTSAHSGTFYLYNEAENRLDFIAAYAFHDIKAIKQQVRMGEGWLGQVAQNGKTAIISNKINNKVGLESSLLNQKL